MMKKISVYILMVLGLMVIRIGDVAGQVQLSEEVKERLAEAGCVFYQPVENTFKLLKHKQNSIQEYDFALKHRATKTEVRYWVIPASESNAERFPHMHFSNRVITMAENGDEENERPISIIQINETDLKDEYQADWGAIAFFKPKKAFANYRHCKVTALFKEGKGYIYYIQLFDEANTKLNEVGRVVSF